MASFETAGVLKLIKDTQIVSEKFTKREFVVTTDGETKYPQDISFQFTQDKCGLLDQMKVGDEVKVGFNLRGRLWKDDKYFTTLEAWRIDKLSGGAVNPYAGSTQPAPVDMGSGGGDLPF